MEVQIKVSPIPGQVKGVHHHQPLIIWNVKGTYLRKRRSKLWTVKWQQTHNSQQLNLKKQKRTKLEQTQIHRNGEHREGYQQGGQRQRIGKKVQGIRSINGRYKTDRGRLRIVMGNGEAKELICTTHGHELRWGMTVGGGEYRAQGNKREEKKGQL